MKPPDALPAGPEPLACYALLGVAPWMDGDAIDRHFAARFRAARRAEGGPSQAELNGARAWFTDPERDAQRRFWAFPLGLAPGDLAFSPEAQPPADMAAVRSAILASLVDAP